ncbi:MAG: phosphatidylglycerophosphatase B [Parcubacteria group bacterium Gr01-1014_18]|nr:MAG: phosphatidylglycerophosphatase B [Parcubacteria group bacterium Greene0416_36]TSC81131.1 MAG: phosphatidylglycerophosphatase B [Parcubacteria group bacterium Gr01-1014_18]TSC98452.1 MAG: phosphatidylglycerophosphatase B [Parcubacteria group bacterium Greene1014_20]TSD07382.1 MAG: phosphatidylglycerophosphatase B [Parcubacteria group bacterium Greene0714_2]
MFLQIQSLDYRIVEYFALHRSDFLTSFFMFLAVWGGEIVSTFLTILILGFLWKRREIKTAIVVFGTLASGATSVWVIKFLVGRSRPDESFRYYVETGFSFPSGHATFAVCLYLSCIYILDRYSVSWKWRLLFDIVMISVVLAMGLSRVYLGVHYPTDVLGGFALGFLSFLFFWALGRTSLLDRWDKK